MARLLPLVAFTVDLLFLLYLATILFLQTLQRPFDVTLSEKWPFLQGFPVLYVIRLRSCASFLFIRHRLPII